MNTAKTTPTMNPAAAILWASAFVITALVIMQAGRMPGNAAYAEMVADHGSYTLMTGRSGNGPDSKPNEVLYIIDSRDQMLMVYEVEDARKKQVLLRDGYSLDALFQRARQ